jgi:release factor glutamine methyltransferase
METTRRNAVRNNADISVFQCNILNITSETELPGLDIIVSNPPYVLEKERKAMSKNVLDHEPGLALFVSDDDPLIFYSRIADFALIHLNAGGSLYFEINEAYGNECSAMLHEKGFSETELKKDIHGKDRMIRSVLHRT